MAMGDRCLAEQRLPPTGGRGCAAIAVTADCPLLGAAPFANAPRRTPQLPLGSANTKDWTRLPAPAGLRVRTAPHRGLPSVPHVTQTPCGAFEDP